MPDWYILMLKARRHGVPFWPAASVLDIPTLIFEWHDIAAAAEAKARPFLERKAAEAAAR